MGAYIDRDELLELYANTDELDISNCDVKVAVIRQNILDMPTIDIVRCKECKMWNKFEGGIWEEVEGEYGFCTLRVDAYKPFGEDNYCSYGERRTDEGITE